jgi:TolA-binding protein
VRPRHLILLLALGLLAGSCAYYNTFYLARKYYFKATDGAPYMVNKAPPGAGSNLTKSIDLSKKVLANYPKSKWVDDAYLLWAQALLGRDDPRETVNMLQDFGLRFPGSDLADEVLFYLGVGYRQSHRPGEAEQALERFLERAPKSKLAPYAWLERARALTTLDHDSAAAYCAGQVLERFPKSTLGPPALAARAEALLAAGQYGPARADFQALGLTARDDEERFGFLLREVDCLEGTRDYDQALGVLRQELALQRPPEVAAGEAPAAYKPTPDGDRYGRVLLRVGTADLLAERRQEALDAYREVVRLYPKSPLSAEAQYRLGYTLETVGEDFDGARVEYARVAEQFANSSFTAQAQGRLANLERMTEFRKAGGDTLQTRAEAGFLLAEIFLFQQGRAERALEEYRKVAAEFDGTPWAAKALTAQAWVLSRKLGRQAEADSLLWTVVRRYPATESQIAARDYLEQAGIAVPDSLIRMPLAPQSAPTDTTRLTPPPAGPTPLGSFTLTDSAAGGSVVPAPTKPVRRRAFRRNVSELRPGWDPRYAGTTPDPGLAGDSPYTAPPDSVATGADSVRTPAAGPRDTLRGQFER